MKRNNTPGQIINQVFSLSSYEGFEKVALEIFNFQYQNINIYRKYAGYLGIRPEDVRNILDIPFLPIEFFKTQKIITQESKEQIIFKSSGTTGNNTSSHYVADVDLYIKSFTKTFEYFYGNPQDYRIIALVPSYQEREGSSLLYMLSKLFDYSGKTGNGFYLNEDEKLYNQLKNGEQNNEKTILFGVGYALLDFADKYNLPLKNTIIIETGGMKGRRKEITKEEMYALIEASFPGVKIHSEYGMTELLSQSYSLGHAQFKTPPWMHVLIRDVFDPFSYMENGRKGGINIIDLANIYSCSFIETKDIGTKHDTYFTVHGRIDNSDIRGCNLLVE